MPKSAWVGTSASTTVPAATTPLAPASASSTATWGSITGSSPQAAPAGGWTGNHGAMAVGVLTASSYNGYTPLSTTGTAADSSKLGGQLPAWYQQALGFTPINKAGDTGIGALSMGALTATRAILNSGDFLTWGGAYASKPSIYSGGTGDVVFYPQGSGSAYALRLTLGNGNFNGSSVSMGALTATTVTTSNQVALLALGYAANTANLVLQNPGQYIGIGNYSAGVAKIAQCTVAGAWDAGNQGMELYLGYNNNVVLHTGNVGTNAATLQAAVASATAPMVGTHAQMIAFGVPLGASTYWYATDDTETDGALGKLWHWSGSAWVAVGTPSTIVGRVTAGVISAGAVGAQAIAADVALIGQTLRNTGFTAGTSSVAPSGFKFSGTVFTATLLDGTTLSVFGELGADLSIGGLKAAVIANRVKGNLFYRNTAGTTDVFVPDGVVSIEVTLQATGGNGASSYGTGGAGGQYIKAMVTVKPHNTYRLTLGAAGSNSTFTWVSFDGTSGFTTDSGFATITATYGAAGSSGSGTGAQGADIGFSFPGPESSWNVGGAAGGDNLAAGAISAAGRGGNIYGLGSGGSGGGTTATKQGGGGGGASATGNGGGGGMNPANGSAGTSGGGGGGGASGGAGGIGFVRAKW